MRYPAYPRYGAESHGFLGRLPDHWAVRRLRFVTSGIEQGWSPQCDNTVAEDDAWGVMKVGCVNGDKFDPLENKALPWPLVPKPEYELFPRDVLISRANTKDLVGSAAVVPEGVRSKLMLCDKLFRIRATPRLREDFLTYFLRTPAARCQYEMDATGASGSMQNIGQDTIKNVVLPLPALEDQARICAFLDWKTAQVDALIAKKTKLIEKLEEERTAVISQAVTKGIDPGARMRESGVPWLGQVPEHWAVKRLKWAVMLQRGHDLPADDRGDGDVPVVTSSGISAVHDKAIAKAPGIVTGRYGTIGVFHLVERDYWPLNTTLYSIDLYGNCPSFLRSLMESLAPLFLLNAVKSAVPGVDRNDLHSLLVAMPEVEEQTAIANHIDIETRRIEQVREKAKLAVARLTEYRTALITAATTGQIDVRQVAIPTQA